MARREKAAGRKSVSEAFFEGTPFRLVRAVVRRCVCVRARVRVRACVCDVQRRLLAHGLATHAHDDARGAKHQTKYQT